VFYLLSFFYGATIGSFVGVVVTRLNVAPIASSRSKCLSCGEALRVSDLIPIVSYLWHKGKCAYCRVPYGVSSLGIEIGFGILFVLLYHFILTGLSFAPAVAWLVYYTVLFISLGVIGLYDLRHSYVPVLYLSLFSFLTLCMLVVRYLYDPSIPTLLGPLVVSLPFLVIWGMTRGRALGFGDVVLFMAVGAFFGIEQGLAVLLISIWLGAIVGVIIYLMRKRKNTHSTAIPFVPFIVIAFYIVLFTDISVFSFATLFL
jgi:prepilin signal peptidase PulO-like enzyme (type II secretory pathway)